MLGLFSLCGGFLYGLFMIRDLRLKRTYTHIHFLFAFYSTKKKKMADKILPQRVSIHFVEVE